MSTPLRKTPLSTTRVDPDQLAQLDLWLGISRPGSAHPYTSWTDSMRDALAPLLDGSWDGGSKTPKQAVAFRCSALMQTLVGLCGDYGRRSSVAWGMDLATQDRAARAVGELGTWMNADQRIVFLEKAVNKCCAGALLVLGPFQSRAPADSPLARILDCLARAGGHDVALRVARRLVASRWAFCVTDGQWPNSSTYAGIYSNLFSAHGVSLAELWQLSPKPGQSMAAQAQSFIDKMGPASLKAAFQAACECKDIDFSLRPAAARGADAWLAEGMSPEELALLTNMVSRLAELNGGKGAQSAIEWLRTHPQLAAEFGPQAIGAPPLPKAAPRRI